MQTAISLRWAAAEKCSIKLFSNTENMTIEIFKWLINISMWILMVFFFCFGFFTNTFIVVSFFDKILSLPGEVSLSRTRKAPSLLCSRRVCSACFLVIFPWNQLDNKRIQCYCVDKRIKNIYIIVAFTYSAIAVNTQQWNSFCKQNVNKC